MLNQKGDKNQVFQAKKSLGQNFLIDENIITFIVNQLEIKSGDIIVEIGPGHGELTKHIIAHKPKKLILIEKDKRLISKLREKFSTNVEIIEGDALKMLPELFCKLKPTRLPDRQENYKLIGNIPYYITGHLLRVIGELETKPKTIVLTIQKEVAERICAEPPQMNLLAASVQFWGKPELLKTIDKKNFNPAPKVDSAVIKIKTKNNQDDEKFYKLIKILFKQPRKTIWNNLKQGLDEEELKQKLVENGINPNDRPQNLSVEDIKKITKII